MLILPKPSSCSIKLQPTNNQFPMPGLVSTAAGKHASYVAIISTLNTSYQTKSLGRVVGNPGLQESSSRRGKLFPDQTLTTRNLGENGGKSGYSSFHKLKTNQVKDREALEKEVESIICRLKIVVQRIRELEIQKLMGRFKGTNTMSDEDRLLVEDTSRKIVEKFLLRPVQYLKCHNGDFKKLKDLNLLIRMLEKSFLESQR